MWWCNWLAERNPRPPVSSRPTAVMRLKIKIRLNDMHDKCSRMYCFTELRLVGLSLTSQSTDAMSIVISCQELSTLRESYSLWYYCPILSSDIWNSQSFVTLQQYTMKGSRVSDSFALRDESCWRIMTEDFYIIQWRNWNATEWTIPPTKPIWKVYCFFCLNFFRRFTTTLTVVGWLLSCECNVAKVSAFWHNWKHN